MVRVFLYFLLLAGMAAALAWLADRPGNLTVQWLGYEVQTSVFIAAILQTAFLAGFVLLGWFAILVLTGPRRLRNKWAARKNRIGFEALRQGIFAAGAGDAPGASRSAAIALKSVPDEPLTLLLQAQAAQLAGDGIAARQAFERMLTFPAMSALGMRGLYLEANRAGEPEAAKQFAERALSTYPSAAWSSAALFEAQIKESDWRGALKTLNMARQYRHLDRLQADARRTIILTALAGDLEDTDQAKALDHALEAHALEPALVPAAVIAGRILAAQGQASRAAKIIIHAWKLNPHPDLALIYAYTRPGDSPQDRLARVKTLTSGSAGIEACVALATAAIEAQAWDEARRSLEPQIINQPQARMCILMARIELGQNRDYGRAREWLGRAVRAAPDPAWVAPDGSVSKEWRPVSESGSLGAFQWKIPAAQLRDDDEGDALLAALTAAPALDALAAAAPVRTGEETVAHDKPDSVSGTHDHDEKAAKANMDGENQEPPVLNEAAQAADEGGPQPQPQGEKPVSVSSAAEATGEESKRFPALITPAAAANAPGISRSNISPRNIVPPKPSRQPKIFVAGPAPDDPGLKDGDADPPSTPLSRYRQPN